MPGGHQFLGLFIIKSVIELYFSRLTGDKACFKDYSISVPDEQSTFTTGITSPFL